MKAILAYDIVEGETRETHRWIIPGDATAEEILEFVDNSPYIDRESIRIFSASEWEEE